jgi:hypothetical protein
LRRPQRNAFGFDASAQPVAIRTIENPAVFDQGSRPMQATTDTARLSNPAYF